MNCAPTDSCPAIGTISIFSSGCDILPKNLHAVKTIQSHALETWCYNWAVQHYCSFVIHCSNHNEPYRYTSSIFLYICVCVCVRRLSLLWGYLEVQSSQWDVFLVESTLTTHPSSFFTYSIKLVKTFQPNKKKVSCHGSPFR